jgi:hypothetical protein
MIRNNNSAKRRTTTGEPTAATMRKTQVLAVEAGRLIETVLVREFPGFAKGCRFHLLIVDVAA